MANSWLHNELITVSRQSSSKKSLNNSNLARRPAGISQGNLNTISWLELILSPVIFRKVA